MAENRRRQRVLFLIRNLDVGGAERIFSTYVNNTLNIEPVVLLHRNIIAPGNRLNAHIPCSEILPESHPWRRLGRSMPLPLAESGKKNRSRLEEIMARLPVMERFFEGLQIRKIARQHKCRVISSFMLKSNRVAVFTKLFLARSLRVVVNVHEVMSRHLIEAHPFAIERLVQRWLSRLVFKNADLIVAVAEGVKNDLVAHFGAHPEKIAVVPNPIDLNLIRRMAAEPLEDMPRGDSGAALIVAAGRLVKLKGFDLLIRAFADLPDEIRARLMIVGDGEERQNLQKLVERLRLDKKVFLIGSKKNPWKYMARADIFVLSSHTEAFPNVLGEALALEIPVLATDCSAGIREYLQNGKCGLIVPPGDKKALTRGLTQMLTDSELGRRLVKQAAERVAEFDIARVVNIYENVLHTVLQRT
ncbi:MAG: glycosyltransferase [Deltaproteobacteria bacterium]|jgi:glycosyltransferase involved in cell wall biosynthesis|nr:glycosyltransferase [Deltaproteobacteria bacterium]